MKKQAFATFVYGGYHKFLPFYTHCINTAYPDADIIVFYLGTLPENVTTLLENNPAVTLYNNFSFHHDWLKAYKHRGAVKQSLRHLLPSTYFEAYDAVYMGDVDILILNEAEDLFSFHKKQAQKNKLPFSNKVRELPDGSPSTRLTGLHFILTAPYYKKMQPLIDEVLNDPTIRDAIFSKSERNENVLYYLNKTAFDFNPQELMNNERPWHGFHLGLVRGKDYLNTQTVTENSSLSIDAIKSQLASLYQDSVFQQLLLTYYCPELYHTLLFLDIAVSKEIRKMYQKRMREQKIKGILKRFKKKLKI